MEHADERSRELERRLAERTAELERARTEQETVTEILRVISDSPTDLKPVFDAILENATRLCGAQFATFGLYDGERYEFVAQRGGNAELIQRLFRGPFVPPPGSNLWRTIEARRPVHIDDVTRTAHVTGAPGAFRTSGAKTLLSVPMIKQGRMVGSITIYRMEVRPFDQRQIDLITIFANQAVIAIENVRLFKELQARNAETTEALEQQTATSEILRIISGSPTDTQPVFDAIVKSGVRLFSGLEMCLRLVRGNQTEIVASTEPERTRDRFPSPLNDERRPTTRTIYGGKCCIFPTIARRSWARNRGRAH